jgi:UDP-2,4-diacetamido-2,4,6-trideoxy-beta-L-altropyranose hydrolase
MRVVFRVDASLKMGVGHIMRCLALAQVLKESGANVEFISRKLEGNLIDKIHSSGFNVYELEILKDFEVDNKLAYSHWLGATQQQDADDCINILKKEKINWLIVDHYAINEDWQKMLKPYCKKLMVIDDLADRKHQCDLLLDQNFARNPQDYKSLVPASCKLLLGSKFSLLRAEFFKWRKYSLERRSKPEFKKLLVNMGGIDLKNVTESVLDELKMCNLPSDVDIIVVMGVSAPHIESVRLKAGMLPYKVEIKVDVNNMAEVMANVDISIGASGATTWERCCLGLPSIQLVTAYNQQFIADNLAKMNIIKLTKIYDLCEVLATSQDWMADIGQGAQKIVDGRGSSRVLEYLE